MSTNMDERLQDRLRSVPGWRVEWALLDDYYGVTDFGRRVIVLDIRLTPAEERSTLAMELERRDRGLGADDEQALENAAARWLIPSDDLALAASVSSEVDEVAAVLGVDRPMLEARLDGLAADERMPLGALAAVYS